MKLNLRWNYKLSEEDYINFNIFHYKHAESYKKNVIVLGFVLPLIFAPVIYVIGVYILNQPSKYWIYIAIIFYIGWAATFPLNFKRILTKEVKKMLKGDNSMLFNEKTIEILDNEIIIYDEESRETLAKSRIQSIKQDKGILIVYISGINAIVLPIRDIEPYTVQEVIYALEN